MVIEHSVDKCGLCQYFSLATSLIVKVYFYLLKPMHTGLGIVVSIYLETAGVWKSRNDLHAVNHPILHLKSIDLCFEQLASDKFT